MSTYRDLKPGDIFAFCRREPETPGTLDLFVALDDCKTDSGGSYASLRGCRGYCSNLEPVIRLSWFCLTRDEEAFVREFVLGDSAPEPLSWQWVEA